MPTQSRRSALAALAAMLAAPLAACSPDGAPIAAPTARWTVVGAGPDLPALASGYAIAYRSATARAPR